MQFSILNHNIRMMVQLEKAQALESARPNLEFQFCQLVLMTLSKLLNFSETQFFLYKERLVIVLIIPSTVAERS